MTSAQATARPGGRRMKIGLMLPIWTDGSGLPRWTSDPGAASIRWTNLATLAQLAEEIGLDSLWVPDHFLMDDRWDAPSEEAATEDAMSDEPPSGAWDCWSILAALATSTSRVELGTLVSCTAYRNPALLARIADTVDEISGGRVILGVGAGDHWREHQAFGFAWGRPIGRFEEALQIIVPLLRDGRVDFVGEHYSARDCELLPRGPRSKGPPILIGALGTGPRMLRLVARYADMWNGWFAFDDDPRAGAAAAMLRVDAACIEHGRDPATLERTVGISVALPGARAEDSSLSGTPEEIAAGLSYYAGLGVHHLQVVLAPPTPAGVKAFGKVLRHLDEMA